MFSMVLSNWYAHAVWPQVTGMQARQHAPSAEPATEKLTVYCMSMGTTPQAWTPYPDVVRALRAAGQTPGSSLPRRRLETYAHRQGSPLQYSCHGLGWLDHCYMGMIRH